MAERCLLHQNKLDLFKWWLSSRGYEIQQTKGIYEVLRAKKNKETVIVFRKANAKEHLSVQDKDYRLIRQFLSETRTPQKIEHNSLCETETYEVGE